MLTIHVFFCNILQSANSYTLIRNQSKWSKGLISRMRLDAYGFRPLIIITFRPITKVGIFKIKLLLHNQWYMKFWYRVYNLFLKISKINCIKKRHILQIMDFWQTNSNYSSKKSIYPKRVITPVVKNHCLWSILKMKIKLVRGRFWAIINQCESQALPTHPSMQSATGWSICGTKE